MIETMIRSRRQQDRQFKMLAHKAGSKVQFGNVGQRTRLQLYLAPAFAVPTHRVFIPGSGIDILEDHLRHSLLRGGGKIIKRKKIVERDLWCVGGLEGHLSLQS